jgi:hypothetical protein
MHQYSILVADTFEEKFESFLRNLNIINSKNVVSIISKAEIIAIPKESQDGSL